MSNIILLKGGITVNEGCKISQDILISNGRIKKLEKDITPENNWKVVNLDGK